MQVPVEDAVVRARCPLDDIKADRRWRRRYGEETIDDRIVLDGANRTGRIER